MNTNIIFFYIYRIASRFYFHLAFLFVYFYTNDIDILTIELLLASYGVMLMVSSRWKSILTKFLSEKYIIILGEVVKAFGLLLLTVKSSFFLLLMGQVFSGIGYSLTAGTDSSLLRTILLGEASDRYKKIEASSNSIMFISFMVAGIIGSIIFSYNEMFVFYFSIAANVIAILSITRIKIPDNLKVHLPSNREVNAKADGEEMASTHRFWKTYYSISRAFPLAIFVGFLPYYLFVEVSINLYFFGLILSLFTLAGFIAARVFTGLVTKIGYKRITILTMSLSIISMLLLGLIDNVYLCTIVVVLLGLSSGGVRPLTLIHLNTEQLKPAERISLFSSMEELYGFWNASLLILGGSLFTYIGFQNLMFFFTLLYGALLLVIYKKYRSGKNPGIKSISKGVSS